MNWQDELRKLDDELATGRISADDYRVRRDQVLSSSNASGQQDAGQRWQAQPPSTGPTSGAQATQFIAPVGGGGQAKPNPDATQVVTPRPADSDRTQVVPGAGMGQPNYGPPSPAHGFQQQQPPPPPPWQTGGGDQTPPWVIPSNDGWQHTGPEVFDETSSGKGKKIFAIIGVVLVIALIGGGIWWFGLREGSGGGGETSTPAAATTTTTTSKPKTALELLPDAPGTPNAANGETTPEKLVEATFLSQEELVVLSNANVNKVAFKAGKQDEFTYDAQVYEAATPEDATALAAALAEYSTGIGMVDGAKGELPESAKVLQLIKPKNTGSYRGIYATGKRVVRITTTQQPIGDTDSQVIKKFQEFGIAVAKKFPVS